MSLQPEPAAAMLPADAVVPDVRRPGNARAWVPVAVLLWFPLVLATGPSAFADNEGWNTCWQQNAAAGRLLYGSPPWWTIQNYPPLSFHPIGVQEAAFGDTNIAGRAVSLALVCLLPAARLRFSAAFMRTLLTYYTPAMETAEFFVLVSSDGPWLGDGPCR